MKNLIFLTIDTLSYKILNEYPFKDELFLFNTVAKNSLVCENMFTQGPYTEASMNGLICGQRGLDYSSFMYGTSKCPKEANLFYILKQNGYSEYLHASFTGCLCSKNIRDIVDEWKYSFYSPIWLSTLHWNRFLHFRDLSKSRDLNQYEMECLITLFDLAFQDSVEYCKNFEKNDKTINLIVDYYSKEDMFTFYSLLKTNYSVFLSGKEKYVTNVLKDDSKFFSFQLHYNVPFRNPKEYEKLLLNYQEMICKSIRRRENSFNFFCQGLKDIFTSHSFDMFARNIKKYFFNGHKKTNESIIRHRLSLDFYKEKAVISFKRMTPDFSDWIKNQKSPYFVYCQPCDFHVPASFYSFDSNHSNLLNDELSDIASLAKRIPKTFASNVSDIFAIKYIDSQIKLFFDELNKIRALENSIVVITADHGSWEYFDKKRNDFSLIMNEERLHIPFYIYEKGRKHSVDSNLHNSYSIPNTILKELGIAQSKQMFGKSISDDKENKYLICENLGFGCPDIYNVPINYTIHNRMFKLVIFGDINKDLDMNDIRSFYDLRKDPNETYNRISKIRKKKYLLIVDEMFQIAKNRHNEVKVGYTKEKFYCLDKGN